MSLWMAGLLAATSWLGSDPFPLRQPLRLHSEPVRRIEAKLTMKLNVPSLTATEWVLIAPKCPELPGQSKIRASLEKQRTEKWDSSPLRRPILSVRVPVRSARQQQELEVDFTCTATLHARRLASMEANDRRPAAAPLSAALTKAYLAANSLVDHEAPSFRAWLKSEGLRRGEQEGEVDFAYRVFTYLRSKLQYEYKEEMDRRVSHVCQSLQTDCGGMSCLFVGILRANGMPARVLVGRWAQSAESGAKLGGVAYYQTHVKAEFFVQGLGWVPVDLSAAVNAEPPQDPKWFFGNDPGDFLVFHVDYDLQVDSIHFGTKTILSMQGIQYWAAGTGDFSNKEYRESWLVKPLPLERAR